MKCVKEKVAKALGVVRPDDMEVVHVDCDLGDLNMKVCETGLGEGDSVEVRCSQRYQAKKLLEDLRVRCSVGDLCEKVLRSDKIAKTDEDKAGLMGLMIEYNVDIVNSTGLCNKSALWYAARFGYPQVATLLLDQGADVNAPDATGRTPLFVASYAGHLPLVKLLIAAGSDVNQPDSNFGETPLHAAAVAGHMLIVRELLAAGAQATMADALGASKERYLDVAAVIVKHL
eukprot:TRINITY_DN4439_c0_g3_i1.p1 TRINITY_DN4439_c0_g3~~TRINITY_DN4439_c0_g3_i1.p1  ORF type:complete len:270 (+),score=63.30 TRINITY_DN4439_c0_g3_i1:121-810(+)